MNFYTISSMLPNVHVIINRYQWNAFKNSSYISGNRRKRDQCPLLYKLKDDWCSGVLYKRQISPLSECICWQNENICSSLSGNCTRDLRFPRAETSNPKTTVIPRWFIFICFSTLSFFTYTSDIIIYMSLLLYILRIAWRDCINV